MFKRHHHNLILKALKGLNSDLLIQSDTFFSGGTAISLKNDEFRESIDIDFLCFSSSGYRKIRNQITNKNLGKILIDNEISIPKGIKFDRYGIRCVLQIENVNIRFEIVSETRQENTPGFDTNINGLEGVPVLNNEGLLTQKMLAMSDRGTDKFNASRDAIDFIVLANNPYLDFTTAFNDACFSYGEKTVIKGIQDSIETLLNNESYYQDCLKSLDIDKDFMYKNICHHRWQGHLSKVGINICNNISQHSEDWVFDFK